MAPARGIDFGTFAVGNQVTRTLAITNTGSVVTEFHLRPQVSVLDSGTVGDRLGHTTDLADAQHTLLLYRLSQWRGTLDAGGTCEIRVTHLAKAAATVDDCLVLTSGLRSDPQLLRVTGECGTLELDPR